MCTNLNVARSSQCPSDLWKSRLATFWVHGDMSYLNIGANKGYNVLEFLLRHEREDLPSMKKWNKLLIEKSVDQHSCGVCRSCKLVILNKNNIGRVKRIKAVEFLSNNYNVLKKMFNTHIPRVQVIHAAAVKNYDVKAYEPLLKHTGHETIGISKHGRSVSTITLDDLTDHTLWDMVSIDAEGSDGDIIQGGNKSIYERRIRVLEFEYSGKWKNMLSPTIQFLASHNYQCFWTGNNGSLARVSPMCPDINIRKWSNIVCTHEQKLITHVFSKFIIH